MARAQASAEPIAAPEIAEAVTRAPLAYADGATQVFTSDGRTIYTENGTRSSGEWGVDDQGNFWSFWPPAYRATYDVYWARNSDGDAVGIRFAQLDGAETFEGRYTPQITARA